MTIAEHDDGPNGLRDLFRRLEQGDLDVLGELYDRSSEDLFALALWITGSRDDAAEVVQDVFVKLASGAAAGTTVRRPRAYLLAAARRTAIDRLRTRRDGEPADDLFFEAPADDPAGRLDAAVASRHLRRLPRRQREAIYLRYFAELSFLEIGRATGVSLFTAASRCRLGLRKLRLWMEVEE